MANLFIIIGTVSTSDPCGVVGKNDMWFFDIVRCDKPVLVHLKLISTAVFSQLYLI